MLTIFEDLFHREIRHKSDIPFSAEELGGPIWINRASLRGVDNWIDEKAFARSYFPYGVPGFLKPVINKPIGNAPTYTDLMVLLAKRYFQQANYLEIGVSVCKKFFQLLNALYNTRFTAFDIEEINPVLAKKLTAGQKTEWDTPAGSIKKNRSSLSSFTYGSKEVNYLSGDIWDTNSWAKLEGNTYNMVFSDFLHTPKAILFEFKMLVKYKLLGDRFIIVWDDMVGKMKNSFFRIIRKYSKVYEIRDIYLLQINGWVGKNEGPHSVGIISNFAL
jgi:hypothetical protein